jgi:tetratricopeptide (TPR) repeat protein
MVDESSFSITLPNAPEGKKVSAEEAEKLLVERLEKLHSEFEKTAWQLAELYNATGRQAEAIPYLNRLALSIDDPDRRAECYLRMGQLMEKIHDYDSASGFYRDALSLEPTNNQVWYLINNNLGYCLNCLGRHREAEAYCRAAIRIEPRKHIAYKNLGLSLEGQGRHVEAAKGYIAALRANPADARALKHLEALIAEHSEISLEIKDIFEQLDLCRSAVRQAAESLEESNREKKPAGPDSTASTKEPLAPQVDDWPAEARAVNEAGKTLAMRSGEAYLRAGDISGERVKAGFRPTDYCYNRINKHPRACRYPVFERVGPGKYRYLGPNYPYTGSVYWKPKGQPERQVGEWKAGVLHLWEDPRTL